MPTSRPGAGEVGAALVDGIRRALAAHADPERAVAQQRYMKSAMPYLGLSMPVLRAALRPVLTDPDLQLTDRDEWDHTVRTLWDEAAHREERYAATALTGHPPHRRWQDSETIALYEHLITTGAWWDLVDPIAADRVGPIVAAHPDVEGLRMREWACGPHLWLRRTAIICQLTAKQATDTALLTDCILPNLMPARGDTSGEHDGEFAHEFFIRKAIGWALRQHARTDPAWVRAFVDTHHAHLSGLSRREALKHL